MTTSALRRRRVPTTLAVAVIALFGAACGGDDGAQGPASASPTGGSAPGGTTTSGSVEERCEAIFSDDEVAELFGEPAVLDEASEQASLGGLLCSWTTTEDDDDFTAQVLVAQVYSGDPVAGENFYDESIYDDAAPVDGIGDRAFLSSSSGQLAFVDGKVAGFLGYSAIGDVTESDVGDDEIIALGRVFHQRVT